MKNTFLFLMGVLISNNLIAAELTAEDRECARAGFVAEHTVVDGLQRKYIYKLPARRDVKGAIIVMHGGGGQAAHFCAGGVLVRPQVRFAREALRRGFAVFLLDSTDDIVTDAKGLKCGKRFDFAVTDRPNVDLPFIDKVMTQIIPLKLQSSSQVKIFITGLSTGGYMTIRASTKFDGRVAAFAPVSAGDPYGTDPICDPRLSPRESAKGILVDRETQKEIVEDGACLSARYPRESPWETSRPRIKPRFMQLHHEDDGIVDMSCMRKANRLLNFYGYRGEGPIVIRGVGGRRPLRHLWNDDYNKPILDFFESTK